MNTTSCQMTDSVNFKWFGVGINNKNDTEIKTRNEVCRTLKMTITMLS